MNMWVHPNSLGHNFVGQFPEIFDKYEPMRFQLSGDRMSDFFAASSFLFGAVQNHDINMIFSAVQRAVQGDSYKTFYSFLRNGDHVQTIFNSHDVKGAQESLDVLWERYNDEFGMARCIKDFYVKWLDESGKKTLCSKLYRPAGWKDKMARSHAGRIEIRIDLLLGQRNSLDHRAEFTPFHNGSMLDFLHLRIWRGRKEWNWLSKLSFDEFYELTRRAMAGFWISEYEEYLENGGEERINKLVEEVLKQTEALNKKQPSSGGLPSDVVPNQSVTERQTDNSSKP